MAAGTSRCNDLSVDDFYFSALFDKEEIFPISDETYAEELQLQEALMASAIFLSTRTTTPHSGTETRFSESKKRKGIETGESSQSHSFCSICMDKKTGGEMFRNNSCTHSFCSDCIAKHVAAKIQENISMVKCPDLNCKGVLQPEICRPILPQPVFDRWENALCESIILGSQKFYCPFKDCSAMLVDDGGETVTVSECPNCRRLFCAQCKVPWHAGMECLEFRRFKEDGGDAMFMELAKEKKWRMCPKCKIYVEKSEGCLHMTCRCRFEFCYGCGSKWTTAHDGCR